MNSAGVRQAPGSQAPCLSLPALWNSMPRALCRCSGAFASFLRSAHRSEPNRAPTPFTWPCPMPFPEASDANRPGLWKKRLINLTVARLSYEHLGCPSSCPSTIRLGVPLNRKQWQQVKNLQHLVFGSFFPLTFEPQDYGRIGHKVEGQAKILSALGRAAASVCRGFSAGYLPRSVSVESAPSSLGPAPAQIVGTLPGKPDIAAMPIVADRVKLPACPTFVASPYMDRTTADFFENPLHHARVPDPAAERPPFVKILADSRQKLLLLQALARSGRLEPLSFVPREREDWGAGLFAVAKDGARDRLVLDARPANELENFPGRWVHTLASAACLGCLNLRPDEVLIMCGTDLQDCFYQFKATPERLVRNHLACKLTLSEAAFVFGRPADSFQAPGGFVWCGLSSLAMGDSSACEFAQCSHLGVLAQARVVHAGELLVQAAAPPRGLLSVGLVIDDLIVLQRCLALQLPFFAENPGRSEASTRLRRALAGYDSARLRYSDKKTFEDKTQASFWGVDCCGVSGLIRANPARYWPLVLITVRVLQLGLATRSLLESLLGSWVSVFMLRRRMLSLVELCFAAVRGGTAQSILRLSPELKAELASFVCLGHLAVVDLRAQPLTTVIASDASSSWQAAVSAEVALPVVEEFQRHSLQRGAWTKLLAPPSAWLKEHNLLQPEAELPGDFEFVANPVAECLARVPQYKTRWRRQYTRRMHINVAELGAYLHEEARLAGRVLSGRPLCALDSQVCLGALVKGRSASWILNCRLRASLAPLLGSRLFPSFLFFPSALNPADDPTRHAEVRAPSMRKPAWWTSLEEGEVGPFEAFLAALPPKVQGSEAFEQDDLLLLGGSRPAALQSNRERGLSSVLVRSRRRATRSEVSRPRLVQQVVCGSAAVGADAPSWLPGLQAFPIRQFLCSAKTPLNLAVPGVLELSPARRSISRALLRYGAPWVLTFDSQRSAAEDLSSVDLRARLEALLRSGAFSAVGGLPSASSFSRAIRPPVRSRSHPLGLWDFSSFVRAKVSADNVLAKWFLHIRSLCVKLQVVYWVGQPDTSLWWLVPGWEEEAWAHSATTFRVDMCQFGCRWRKRTRVATNCSLGGARLLCKTPVRHLRLAGHSSSSRLPWTSLADTVPAGFADALAVGLCAAAQWTSVRPLDPAACAKLGCLCRVGEAKNPGPRRRASTRTGDLESRPLQSGASLFLGSSAWAAFLRWVSPSLSVDPVGLFVVCPLLAAMALRAYGNELFQAGGSKHTFRYTLVGAQRAIISLKGSLGPAWELLSRWEAVEPVIHRTPVPEPLLLAMVTLAWLRGYKRWCGCALLAFYGMARVGEVLNCQRRHLLLPEDLFLFCPAVFLRLDSSKTSLRGRPKVQHIRVDDVRAMALIQTAFAELEPHERLYPFSPSAFRTRWDRSLQTLGLQGLVAVTPGGLRGGGAVAAYHRGCPISDIQWKLRLKHMATLEHYLQEVAALSALEGATVDARTTLRTVLQLFPFLA